MTSAFHPIGQNIGKGDLLYIIRVGSQEELLKARSAVPPAWIVQQPQLGHLPVSRVTDELEGDIPQGLDLPPDFRQTILESREDELALLSYTHGHQWNWVVNWAYGSQLSLDIEWHVAIREPVITTDCHIFPYWTVDLTGIRLRPDEESMLGVACSLNRADPLDAPRSTPDPCPLREISDVHKAFLGLGTESSYVAFASKYGLLTRGAVDGASSAQPAFEPIAFWRWHVSRLAFLSRIYKAANKLPSAKALALQNRNEAVDILRDAPRHRIVGPMAVLKGISSEVDNQPDFAPLLDCSPSYSAEFCPEQLGYDRSALMLMDSKILAQELRNMVLDVVSSVLTRHCVLALDAKTLSTQMVPASLLGAIYLSFLRSIQKWSEKDARLCKGCGETFYPEWPTQRFCKHKGTTDRCRKRYERLKASQEANLSQNFSQKPKTPPLREAF